MAEHRRVAKNLHKTLSMEEAIDKYPHFKKYVEEVSKKMGEPAFYQKLDRSMKKMAKPNLIYPIGDPLFVHVYLEEGRGMRYIVIQPEMDKEEEKLYDLILDKLIEVAHSLEVPTNTREMEKVIVKLLDKVVDIKKSDKPSILDQFSSKIKVTQKQFDIIKYYILRNRLGYGKLEPIFSDSYPEDMHCTGVGDMSMVHKIFGMVYTNINFKDDQELNKYIVEVTERVDRPASDAHSVIDAMMPDGSRSNFLYGRDISLEGSSFTIRKFAEVPISVTQIVNWHTFSAEEAAYVWIALENGMNLWVCGETASGKTTTLNAISAFIKPENKVYTVENTPEVSMPHETWQHLLAREAGKETDVTMQDLLIASLRSRPDYIIIGEIRGAEGNVAFQAMQTGHPVMSTFHAGSVTSMVQRITGPPISVPIASVDNLNLVMIQQAVDNKGQRVRRVLNLTEIERYYAPAGKMVTRQVFEWDPIEDKHIFRGMLSSYILEKKIALMMGMKDPRDIYKVLEKRKKIVELMIKNGIFNYYDVWELLKGYRFGGEEALPFKV